jgi:hypothetical protein
MINVIVRIVVLLYGAFTHVKGGGNKKGNINFVWHPGPGVNLVLMCIYSTKLILHPVGFAIVTNLTVGPMCQTCTNKKKGDRRRPENYVK